MKSRGKDLPGNLLKRRAGHPHEALASGRGQGSTLGKCRVVALDEHVAIFGQDCSRTGTTRTELGKRSILPDDLWIFIFFIVIFAFYF